MTLEQATFDAGVAGTFTQPALTPEATPWNGLRAPEWKAFAAATGPFLLHVPSSHVLEVPPELAAYVRGESADPAAAAELKAIASELPLPPPRAVKTDIQVVSLNMAQGCNLRCTYCFAGEGDYGVKAMMSFATAVKALTYFSRGKDRFHVIFFGGEPMLNFGVIQQVVAWCEAQSCRFTFGMTTNGTLLTEDKLAWVTAKKFHLVWSYDGHGLQARQRLNKDKVSSSEALVERKLTAFAEQLQNLRDFKLRATITRENLDVFEAAITDTLTSRNFRLVISHHATPLKGLMFEPADIDRMAEVLTRVVDRLLAAQDYDRLLRLEFIRGGIRAFHHGVTNSSACGAGVSYLTVSAEGGFYLCHRFNEDESERFGDIDRGVDQARLAQIASFRGAGSDPCKSCWMRQWCAGGCFHENKAASGSAFRLDPMFCKLQDLEMQLAMKAYTVLLRDAPHLLEA